MRQHRNLTWRLVAGFIFALAVVFVALHVVRPFPLRRVQSKEQCRVFLDRAGDVIRIELGTDEQWRIPVPLSRISPHLIHATLAVEDKRFFEHSGVDWIAVGRAVLGNLRSARIVSGASTITMQLGRLSTPDEPWGWTRKLRQTTRALHLEFLRDKNWILEHYLNLAPYGGNLVGCESAARFYLGKPVAELTLSEAAVLAGTPQHPVKLRPDRHPEAARNRQRHVLDRMLEEGMIAPEQHRIAVAADAVGRVLEHRRGLSDDAQTLGLPVDEPIFCRVAAEECPSPIVPTTLDRGIQNMLRTALTERVAELPGVEDGAGVIIENRTGSVRALIGTLDFCESRRGQVNAANAVRSPGSALKPFIYAMALEQGLILPGTRLLDEPLGYEDYRPGNFDDEFRGEVTATRALSESLNTPAVRLLEKVGTKNMLERLKKCGLRNLPDSDADCGLALALGGVGVRLLDLTNAYAVLARGGWWMPARFFVGRESVPVARHVSGTIDGGDSSGVDGSDNRPVFHPGAVVLLREMLNALPLPGCEHTGVCWKTGTSSGFRDAWCFVFDSRFTVGVWLGNKSGATSRSLVGIEAAAPVAARVMNALAAPGIPAWPAGDGEAGEPVVACSASGLRAGPYCRETESARGVSDVSLRQCPVCGVRNPVENEAKPALAGNENCEVRKSVLLIQSPEPGVYRALDDSGVSLPCVSVGGGGGCEWFVDGEFAGRGRSLPARSFTLGRHVVTCTDPDSGDSVRVEFSVRLGN